MCGNKFHSLTIIINSIKKALQNLARYKSNLFYIHYVLQSVGYIKNLFVSFLYEKTSINKYARIIAHILFLKLYNKALVSKDKKCGFTASVLFT